MNWLDRVPWPALVVAALLMGLAPFVPEPHLFQKLRMLAHGQLHAPLDVFDLILHASAPLLVLAKLIRAVMRARAHSSHNQ